jgi:hypothetical protein
LRSHGEGENRGANLSTLAVIDIRLSDGGKSLGRHKEHKNGHCSTLRFTGWSRALSFVRLLIVRIILKVSFERLAKDVV